MLQVSVCDPSQVRRHGDSRPLTFKPTHFAVDSVDAKHGRY